MNPKSYSVNSPPGETSQPEQGHWTYEDWLRLPDDGFRYEVLNGELFKSPPPKRSHQKFSGRLFIRMTLHAEKSRLGEIYQAPTGVRLPGQPVPVQPDVLFVSEERRSILGEDYIEGAPDLIVEVLSPSNWLYDRREKFQVYQATGVREYWIVDPRARTIDVFVLEDGSYVLTGTFRSGDTVRSGVLEGFEIAVDEVFDA
jgi:Uma2 family endonuclease